MAKEDVPSELIHLNRSYITGISNRSLTGGHNHEKGKAVAVPPPPYGLMPWESLWWNSFNLWKELAERTTSTSRIRQKHAEGHRTGKRRCKAVPTRGALSGCPPTETFQKWFRFGSVLFPLGLNGCVMRCTLRCRGIRVAPGLRKRSFCTIR